MNTRTPITTLLLPVGLLAALPAQAALEARDLDNDTVTDAYYDSVLDITWQKNAGLAGINNFGVDGIPPYGAAMNWSTANQWIAAMNSSKYLGYDGWRIAKIEPIGGGTGYTDCCSGFSGRFDFGYNITSPQSELAYMFYVNLANLGLFDINGNIQSGHGSIDDPLNPFDDNLFDNIFWGWYWSGSRNPSNGGVMVLDMANGEQTNRLADGPNYVWAVHQGDIGVPVPIPEPETYALMLAGLGLIVGVVRRKQHLAA